MYIGIDIYKQYAQVAVMDEDGKINREVFLIRSSKNEIARLRSTNDLRHKSVVCFEI